MIELLTAVFMQNCINTDSLLLILMTNKALFRLTQTLYLTALHFSNNTLFQARNVMIYKWNHIYGYYMAREDTEFYLLHQASISLFLHLPNSADLSKHIKMTKFA